MKPKKSGKSEQKNNQPGFRYSEPGTPARKNLEKCAEAIADLNREEVKTRILGFKGRFKMDFIEEYLNGRSVNNLRHILLAAMINARHSGNEQK